MSGGGPIERVRRIVTRVCAAAVQESGAAGIRVLDAGSPEGGLVAGWLEQVAQEWQVWRDEAVAGNLQVEGRPVLVAHPSSKTALLLGGRVPLADLLPAGDLWASQIAEMAGSWSGPPELAALVERAGGVAALDRALQRLVEDRLPPDQAMLGVDAAVAREVLARYEAGRYWRLRPRLTPKLTARTLGIDLFD